MAGDLATWLFQRIPICVPMAAFGLDLDSPLLPNVDSYINPTKDEDSHRSALNAVVSSALFFLDGDVSKMIKWDEIYIQT